jgi:4-hydroxy-3-methylbut-2-enyl diphosphate reductase
LRGVVPNGGKSTARKDCQLAKIIIAQNAGFCSGVEKAYNLALNLAKEAKTVYTLGELIHNKSAVLFLEQNGVKTLDNIDLVKEGDAVVVRTHGVGEETINALKERGAVVYDATCPFVKNIQDIVKKHYAEGYKILIAGDPNHAEVKGVQSYAKNSAQVFWDELPPLLDNEKYCVVFQSTFPWQKSQKIIEEAQKISKDGHKTVVYFNTICYTTKSRQKEAESLAKCADAVVVCGGADSANTLNLFKTAKSVNSNTFLVENADNIPFDIKQFSTLAVVSGASTPKRLLTEVVKRMSETQKDNVVETQATANDTGAKKAATSPTKSKLNKESFSMQDIIDDDKALGFTSITPGKRIKGKVISADESGIRVALGGKKDGFIPRDDATLDGSYNPENFKPDDEIEAQIVSQSKDTVQLSKKKVDQKKLENEEAEKAIAQPIFELVMTEVVKGGLRGKLGGYTVFVPASQIKIGYVHNLEEYLGKKLRLTVMPPKEKTEQKAAEEESGEAKLEAAEAEERDGKRRKSRYIFASQRMILEKEKKEREDAFWNSIHIHDIVVGKVKRFTPIGAFVNVRGYDCLCHISEISWSTISDPSEVLKINESYDFVVLKIDREAGKISLGYKQLQKKPYELAAEKYPIGTIVTGKVARIKSYGAFVQIEDGVDGLVHVSQIAHNWVKDATEVFKVGQEIRAKIINFEGSRITLSMKELVEPPQETEKAADEEESDSETDIKPVKKVRNRKFDDATPAKAKPEKKPRKESGAGEPKEWITASSAGATLGDLFKGLNLEFADEKAEAKADEAEPAQEKPKKKTAKKAEKTTEEE